ncbi:unnamed protein product, partial [Iphiclides podalirius]
MRRTAYQLVSLGDYIAITSIYRDQNSLKEEILQAIPALLAPVPEVHHLWLRKFSVFPSHSHPPRPTSQLSRSLVFSQISCIRKQHRKPHRLRRRFRCLRQFARKRVLTLRATLPPRSLIGRRGQDGDARATCHPFPPIRRPVWMRLSCRLIAQKLFSKSAQSGYSRRVLHDSRAGAAPDAHWVTGSPYGPRSVAEPREQGGQSLANTRQTR